jgi:hypothetical protein
MDRAQRQRVRAAMLSVYYHSIGSRLELRGAPAMMVPPEAEPMRLAVALDSLKPAEARLREAVWTIARAVPAAHPTEDDVGRASRYPRELVDALDGEWRERLEDFDRKRTAYRREAHLYGAALIAYAQSDTRGPFDSIRAQLEQFEGRSDSFDAGTREAKAFGSFSFSDYIKKELVATKTPEKAAERLRKLELELGLGLATYVQEFADAVAFAQSFRDAGTSELSVFPTSSVTLQDARTLQTRVTVSALVSTTNFHCLKIGLDPRSWSLCSDAFHDCRYVRGSYDLTPTSTRGVGIYERDGRRYLFEEDVVVSWGEDQTPLSAFHNLLNVTVSGSERRIDIKFNLNRSISSRILWDERPGGILVDEGYLMARPVTKDVWRVTTRKTLRFSDRTPYAGGAGWHDFGQVLNFLAPAALSLWMESEMYSATCPEVLKKARRRLAQEQAAAAARPALPSSEPPGAAP